ncbi:MAG TPA: electron transfer flavoprotein subunit alpha/FixB family protein [Coleofasciculaceae cyanobacterium]|jgi:electron transfer flavoprotein alpha subunit
MSEHFQGVWVVAELTTEGNLTETSQELMTPARRLGDKLGQPVTGVILSGNRDTSAAEAMLGQLGANQVIVAKDDKLGEYQAEVYTVALSELANARKPDVILMGISSNTADYAPRVAIRTGGGLITNAMDLDLNEQNLVEVTRSCFAESLLSSVVADKRPQLVTVKKKAFPKPVANGAHNASVETASLNLGSVQPRTKMVNVQQTESKGTKKLEEADIIVSGGRGLKGPENFYLVEELASALGGAVGASRAVVDAGWRPHSEQVGQTGKTVSPKVYFALGISGAIQHLVGMNTSQIIIAINRDENAPIFKMADFGIIGDATEIVPELVRTIKEQNLALNV